MSGDVWALTQKTAGRTEVTETRKMKARTKTEKPGFVAQSF